MPTSTSLRALVPTAVLLALMAGPAVAGAQSYAAAAGRTASRTGDKGDMEPTPTPMDRLALAYDDWLAATAAGAGGRALTVARELAARSEALANSRGAANGSDAPSAAGPDAGTLQHYRATPIFTLVRFGRWAEILNGPVPVAESAYVQGVRRFARGIALTRDGRTLDAIRELAVLTALAAEPEVAALLVREGVAAGDVLAIAREVLAAEVAAAQGENDDAIARLEGAIRLEDAASGATADDTGASAWPLPVHQTLGAVLLEAGQPVEAAHVFRRALAVRPNDGWSLYGLYRSLLAQDRLAEAAAALRRFDAAWRDADVRLTAPRF